MEKDSKNKEIEMLLSEKEVVIGDKTIVIKKLSILNTLRLASQLSSVASRVVNNPELSAGAIAKIMYQPKEEDSVGDITGIRMMGILGLLDIIGEDVVDIIRDIIVKSTNLSVKEAEDLAGEEGIDVLFDIYEVNKDFFMKCMNKLKEKISKKVKSDENEQEK